MNKKIIFLVIFFVSLLAVSAVNAAENVTDDETSTTTINADESNVAEVEKISEYNYSVEMPEGDVVFCSELEVKDLPSDASGNISMSVDGVQHYNKYVSQRVNSLNLDSLNLAYGNHSAEIKYSGDEKYEGFIKTSEFNFVPVIIDVPNEVEIGGNDAISVLSASEKGYVEIVIDGKKCFNEAISEYEDWDNGGYSIYYSLNDLTLKTHTYKVTYTNGNQKITKKGSFKTTYLFSIENKDTITYGENAKFKINLPDDAESKVTININNKTYTASRIYGEAVFNFKDFNIGQNNITFTYKDSRYPLKTVSKTINVLANLTAPKTVNYNSNQNISLKLPKDVKGMLNVLINDTNYQCELIDGKASISLNNLNPGDYNLRVTYPESGNLSYTLKVVPNLDIARKLWVNGENELKFISPEFYNGILKLKGLINANISVVNGSARIPLPKLEVKKYTLNAEYVGNNTPKYTWKLNIEVLSENPNWKVDFNYPSVISKENDWDSNYVSVRVPTNMKGQFTLSIDNKTYFTENVGNLYESSIELISDSGSHYYKTIIYEGITLEFDLESLTVGKHNITVSYSGDDYYAGSSKTVQFEIVNVEIFPSNYENAVIIQTNNDDSGKATIYLDGKKVKTIKINGDEDSQYRYNLPDYLKHDVKVEYSGKYGNITKNFTLNPTFFSCQNESYIYNEDNYYDFNILSDDFSKKFEITIDKRKYDYLIYEDDFEEEYYISVNVSDLKPGNHTIEVSYPGDKKYLKNAVTRTISVNPPTIKSPEYNSKFMEDAFFNLTLPDDAVGSLTLKVKYSEDDIYQFVESSEIKDGFAQVKIPTTNVGILYYKVSFNGNYDVEGLTDFLMIDADIDYPYEMTWGSDKYFTLKTKNTTDGYLVIKTFSDEDYYTLRFTGDTAKISLKNLDIGDYSEGFLVAEYYDNGKSVYYEDLSIIVNPIKAKLIGGKDIKMSYTDSRTYSLKIWGDYGKVVGKGELVKIKIGSKIINAKTNADGVVTVKLTQTPGNYIIKASYHGVTVKNKLTVKQILKLKKVTVKKSAKKLVLTATLKKHKKALKNKKVTFKFKGKKYTAKTNKKGIAKITIKKSVLKKLKVGKKVKYQVTYLKDTVKRTVKVKK